MATPTSPGWRSPLYVLSIVLTGLTLRLGYLWHARSQTRYFWGDPDSYEVKARLLAGLGHGWRWTFDAVRHHVDGHDFILPPLYPAFLSVFALLPGFPANAQVAQALLSTASIALLYFLGRELHTERTGLVAAAVYALWLPNIIAVWSTMQESLYIPLTLASFALLFWGLDDERPWWALFPAGVAFGLATLTRSIPLYVLPLLAVVILVDGRRDGWSRPLVQLSGLFAGFALATVPYSVALSYELGSATFVENHGGIKILEKYGADPDAGVGPLATAAALAKAFARSPMSTLAEWWGTAASVLHVNGGRLLQIYLFAETPAGARLWKLGAHLLVDGLFITSLLLAPLGLVLGRRSKLAALFAVWILVNLGLTALSGFGGARLRAPIEPQLIVLGAVVLSGGFRRASPASLGAALALSAVLASTVLPQLPRSFAARGDYGVRWAVTPTPKRSVITATAGFNVLAKQGAVRFRVRSRNPTGSTAVRVALEGGPAERVLVADREHRFELLWPRTEMVYVELAAVDAETGEGVDLFVMVPR